MKNVFKLFGIIVLAAVIVFAGCDNGTDTGGNIIDPLSLDGMNLKDFGANAAITTIDVRDKDEWDEAWDSITTPGNYVINVTGNLDDVYLDLDDNLEPASGYIISLRGADNTITTSNNFWVDSGETVILRNITIAFSDNSSGVNCNDDSTLIMEYGSVITGGSGVNVSDGEFIMNEGKIHGSSNSGVIVEDDGVFIMNGGEIYSNTGYFAGGVLVNENGSFIMNGGEIVDNTGSGAGGVCVYGANSRFEKNPGARICNNTSEELEQGHQVLAADGSNGRNILAYRDNEVTAAETLKIKLNAYGDDVFSATGTWEGFSGVTPTYRIDLSRTGQYIFPNAPVGYTPQSLTVTVTNTGNQPTGALNIALDGANSGNFTRSPTTISNIEAGSDATFTVTPNSGLGANTYTATVTVQGGNSISESFDVSFTVHPAGSNPDDAINLADFGTTTGIIYESVGSGAELQDYLWENQLAPGNYVVTVTGNLTNVHLDVNDVIDPGVVISLRGAGYTLTINDHAYVDSGETLILRGVTITLSGPNALYCNESKLIMEAGSCITGGGGVRVWCGEFIMNGGEIYDNNGEYGGGVTIVGESARFEKNPGARIYNNTSQFGTGHQVMVAGLDEDWNPAAILAYRDDEVTAAETLSITLNADGDGIASETGTWSKP